MRDYFTHAMHDAGRIEVRHNDGGRWRSGIFDDLYRLRQCIDELAGRGNVYTTINAPRIATATNAMNSTALCDNDIAFITRLPIDFDPVRPRNWPSTADELCEAINVRDAFVRAMLALGWPLPATGMSGNGAHALYRCRLRATPQTSTSMRTLYQGWRKEFSSDLVLFDSTVHNPARIWRAYGTTNRKGEANAERPHRMASITIPARWDAVAPIQIEQLATAYATRERRHKSETPRPRSCVPPGGSGDYSTLDIVAWFLAHDCYKRQIGVGKHAVRCPWSSDHSTDDDERGSDTVVWEAAAGHWPTFHCSHAHCEGRDLRHLLRQWTDGDAYCTAQWQRRRP